MALTFIKLFEPVELTASLATYFTVAAVPTTNLLRNARIRLTNTTGAAVTVDVHCVPAAGTAGNSNAIAKVVSIGANAYLDIDLPVMKAGDFLRALASSATAITMHAIDGVIFS